MANGYCFLKSKNQLGNDENAVQRHADGERRAEIGRRMAVAVMAMAMIVRMTSAMIMRMTMIVGMRVRMRHATASACDRYRSRSQASYIAGRRPNTITSEKGSLDRLQELVRLRQALRDPAGIGAVAAVVCELLPGKALVATG